MDVQVAPAKSREFDIEDVEYLRHDDKPLYARLYRPPGEGPFPALVELHGGVWTENDRTRSRAHHEVLAGNGIAVASLDFRQGEGGYPNSVVDINYAIRWVKANAARLKTCPELVGIAGTSSGGHLAMLTAMRPRDPRYAAIPLPPGSPAVDASVRCVVLFWPVINPLGRHQNARRLHESPNPPDWPPRTMRLSLAYWQNEAAMGEGNPLLALECGEAVEMPPAIWIQSRGDLIHDYRDPNSGFDGSEALRFVDRYRKAGGDITLHYFDAPLHFTSENPDLPQSIEAMRCVTEFVHRQIPVK
ncbi:MAG: alpha/beta hydrolase [Xanthobacteraceae bacterium]